MNEECTKLTTEEKLTRAIKTIMGIGVVFEHRKEADFWDKVIEYMEQNNHQWFVFNCLKYECMPVIYTHGKFGNCKINNVNIHFRFFLQENNVLFVWENPVNLPQLPPIYTDPGYKKFFESEYRAIKMRRWAHLMPYNPNKS